MWVMLTARLAEETFGDASHIAPERLPLGLFAPDVGALEQGYDEPLGLHEDRLRCADLRFHGGGFLSVVDFHQGTGVVNGCGKSRSGHSACMLGNDSSGGRSKRLRLARSA